MTEVFITDIPDQIQAKGLIKTLKNVFPGLKINFDTDASEAPFPCGHHILRAEGSAIHSEGIISLVNKSGFTCGILEDKICK